MVPGNAVGLERFEIITTEDLEIKLQERVQGEIEFLLVNCPGEMIYRHSFIPGSINIPLGKTKDHIHKLGTDKNRLIIPY